MRIEKKFLAFGHELDTDVTPIEAGLEFAVAWGTDFIGREALLRRREEGAKTRMVTILVDDPSAVPIGHEPIRLGGRIVGEVKSAAFGYRVGKPIALGYVHVEAPEGLTVEIDIGGNLFAASLTLSPAFDPTGARMRPLR